ncbi:MAG TPA: endonuclease/exonuclease/phosphatase family protein, partial [Spirochaetota bacterium]|nr:endonuclease/exonuclease/phosphatase family protein [Spirochaetota bacterium]
MAGKIITGLVILSIIISCRPRQELLAPVLPVPAEITIASFNIERFNEDKITNQQITRVLAAIISRYDIVAVQETGLFSGGTNIIPFFLSTLNATAPHLYKAVVGPRTGRGGELERGVFFYKSNLIAAGKSRLCYSVTNGYPTFARLPLACAFCCGEFDFVLCNVHTKPARALNEIMALTNIYTEINTFFGEKDVIIAGDLNADNADLYFDEAVDSGLRERSVYYWAID